MFQVGDKVVIVRQGGYHEVQHHHIIGDIGQVYKAGEVNSKVICHSIAQVVPNTCLRLYSPQTNEEALSLLRKEESL